MLHETAVAWMRERLKQTLPARSWAESFDEYGARLQACTAYINENHDVAGLWLADVWLSRLALLLNFLVH